MIRAGIGANMKTLHLFDVAQANGRYNPTLCQTTSVIKSYSGPLSISQAQICRRCFKLFEATLPKGEGITAASIGVAEIQD